MDDWELYLCNTRRFCLLGVTARQAYADIFLWDNLFRYYNKLKQVVELGTGIGGFSLYLLIQCIQRNLKFETWDHIDKSQKVQNSRLGLILNMEKYIRIGDIFKVETVRNIQQRILHPCVFFFDNGNKPEEIVTYVPILIPGDLFAVHDWNIEIFQDDIPSNCIQIFVEYTQAIKSKTAFFEVIE